jgi:hypothetical protein
MHRAIHHFGIWDAMPDIAGSTPVDTPVGETCAWCGDVIRSADLGLYVQEVPYREVVMPTWPDVDPDSLVLYHSECSHRKTLHETGELPAPDFAGPIAKHRDALTVSVNSRRASGAYTDDNEGGW